MNVLLAEDHSIVIRGIKILFETEFTNYNLEIVSTGCGLMNLLKTKTYQLAIIDLQLLDGDTLHVIKDISALYPKLNMLIFTANAEEIYAQRLYQEGIKGYINKQETEHEILTAIRTTLEGKFYISESYKHLLLTKDQNYNVQNPFSKLSMRELEIVKLLLQGKRSQEICNELNLQPSTISTFKQKIFTKLNISNVLELNLLSNNFNK